MRAIPPDKKQQVDEVAATLRASGLSASTSDAYTKAMEIVLGPQREEPERKIVDLEPEEEIQEIDQDLQEIDTEIDDSKEEVEEIEKELKKELEQEQQTLNVSQPAPRRDVPPPLDHSLSESVFEPLEEVERQVYQQSIKKETPQAAVESASLEEDIPQAVDQPDVGQGEAVLDHSQILEEMPTEVPEESNNEVLEVQQEEQSQKQSSLSAEYDVTKDSRPLSQLMSEEEGDFTELIEEAEKLLEEGPSPQAAASSPSAQQEETTEDFIELDNSKNRVELEETPEENPVEETAPEESEVSEEQEPIEQAPEQQPQEQPKQPEPERPQLSDAQKKMTDLGNIFKFKK